MISETVIDLSRFQFAMTALYHFLFVPLTLGVSVILAIMESVYVLTGKQIYKDMTRFWGKLYGINFALGVATGLTMEFQFGTNWAYFSHYVGDVFGAPLGIETLVAFFMESTFVGIFFFGWDRMGKVAHLTSTYLMALGTSLSALWILVANGWMQNPVGAHFDFDTMRMQLSSFSEVFFNPVAQVKFIHTISAGYVVGAVFVMGISAYYMLNNRDLPFARRSFAIATAFGLASVLCVITLGDESGYTLGDVQKVKLAALEGDWTTDPAPASLKLFALPSNKHETNFASVEVPYLGGLIITRSLSTPIVGLKDLQTRNEEKVVKGIKAWGLLQQLKNGEDTPENRSKFLKVVNDLGYGMLLLRYTDNPLMAKPEQIKQAAADSIPQSWPLFFGFRVMVLISVMLLLYMIIAFYKVARRVEYKSKWLLRIGIILIPFPWIAAEMGWLVAEYGRQPWTVSGMLPTFLSSSHLSVVDLIISICCFALLYISCILVEMYLMIKFARLGPSSLHTGRYHFETDDTKAIKDESSGSEKSALA